MTLDKFLKVFGAPQAPQIFFLSPSKAPPVPQIYLFITLFYRHRRRRFPKWVPKTPQRCPKSAPKAAQRRPKGCPKAPQRLPKGAPKAPQRHPKGAPKAALRRPKGAPKTPQRRPKGCPKVLQRRWRRLRSPGGQGKSRRRRVFHEYLLIVTWLIIKSENLLFRICK